MNTHARILVVDDDASFCKSLSLIFEEKGYEVESAATGGEALEKAQAQSFDAALVDVRLPDIKGTELLPALGKTNPDMALIMVTAYASVDTAVDALTRGASGYIRKPPNMNEVLAVVNQAVERQQIIVAKHRAEMREKRLLEQQTIVNQLTLALGESTDLDTIYHTIYEYVRKMMDAETFIVSLFDEESQLIHAGFAVNHGLVSDVSVFPPIPLEEEGRGTQSRVIRTGQRLVVPDLRKEMAQTDSEYKIADDGVVTPGSPPPEAQEDSTNSALFVPMKIKGTVIGVMQVQSHKLDAYQPESVELLSGLANVAAIAIQNTRLYGQAAGSAATLRRALNGTIQALAQTAEVKDPYTAGHQQRVTQLACAIAEELGLPGEQVEGIRVASLLHDIGKIAIPAEILSKPGKLTDVEFSLIKRHPQIAYDILTGIAFPWAIDDIVLQHHERMDGKGYPHRLKGEEILLEARILSVADVVEAMASHRPYRPALGIDVALDEIRSGRGSRYDEQVADACVALFEKRAFAFERTD